MKQKSLVPVRIIAVLVIVGIFTSLLQFAPPLLIQRLVNQEIPLTVRNAVILIALVIAGHLLKAVSILWKNKKLNQFRTGMSRQLYNKIFKMKYDSIVEAETSYLVGRVNSTAVAFGKYYIEGLPSLVTNALFLMGILALVFQINIGIGILMVIVFPVNLVGYTLLNQKLAEESVKMNEIIPKEYKNLYQYMGKVDFIKQNGNLAPLLGRIMNSVRKNEKITQQVNNLANCASYLLGAVNQLIQCGIILVLVYAFLRGQILLGDVFVVTMLLSYYIPAVDSVVNINIGLRDMKAAHKFIREVDEAAEVDGDQPLETVQKVEMRLPEVRVGKMTLLRDVAITAHRGEVIGLVGESGSGKSTLAKELLKFHGNPGIRLNGVPLEKLKNQEVRSRISYYTQMPDIFPGTIEDNLQLWGDEFRYQDLKFLNCFRKQPEGLRTVIVENGNNLSGGERQRISLARFFAEKADVVILDEPTTSLDAETKNEILDSIFTEAGDTLFFLLTHDPELLHYCSRVYRIQDGRVVQGG